MDAKQSFVGLHMLSYSSNWQDFLSLNPPSLSPLPSAEPRPFPPCTRASGDTSYKSSRPNDSID